jgi:REP element-mobilizing transposase RayT
MTEPHPVPRRKRLRAEGYDYASHGSYFVTLCVDNMEERFGNVVDGHVILNDAGQLIEAGWEDLSTRFPSVLLDMYIVMPNHLHGIVSIDHTLECQPPTLSRVVQVFKSITTIAYGRGVKVGLFPPYVRGLWQRGFHDRILRDDRMLERAQGYIEGNPGRWEENRGPGIGRASLSG